MKNITLTKTNCQTFKVICDFENEEGGYYHYNTTVDIEIPPWVHNTFTFRSWIESNELGDQIYSALKQQNIYPDDFDYHT